MHISCMGWCPVQTLGPSPEFAHFLCIVSLAYFPSQFGFNMYPTHPLLNGECKDKGSTLNRKVVWGRIWITAELKCSKSFIFSFTFHFLHFHALYFNRDIYLYAQYLYYLTKPKLVLIVIKKGGFIRHCSCPADSSRYPSLLILTYKEWPQRPVTFDQSDEETWPDKHFDNLIFFWQFLTILTMLTIFNNLTISDNFDIFSCHLTAL